MHGIRAKRRVIPVRERTLKMDSITLNNNLIQLIAMQRLKEAAEPDACLIIVVLDKGVGGKGESSPSKEFVLVLGKELFGFLEHCWAWDIL